ncbi:MAG: hypothetical protein R3C39_05220 [Dehalococcoidia bacterium]
MRSLTLLTASLLMAAAVFGSTTVANAQSYPPPVGNCVFIPAVPNPGVNQNVSILLVWTDTGGNPLPGQTSTISIVKQPGTTATITPSEFTTGADGTAQLTLFTGETAGTITLSATCGSIDTQVVLPVGQPPLPPNTGSAGVVESGVVAVSALVSTLVVAVLAFAGVWVARRRWGFRTH